LQFAIRSVARRPTTIGLEDGNVEESAFPGKMRMIRPCDGRANN
jgi:hypothetical protein